MNVYTKRTTLIFMTLLLALTLSFGAVAAGSANYNSGQRNEVCTSLTDAAVQYYQDNYTYEALSAQEGTDLLASLRTLMTTTHKKKTSYSDCRDMAYLTDSQSGDGKIVLLYTSVLVTQGDFIGSGSIGWNREHVWPKSLGGFKNDGAGADLHHVRPSDVTTNAKRDNLKYGNVEGGTDAKGSSLVGGASGGTYTSSYFEPHDNVKGDVARICLYVYARYGGELASCNKITTVFQSVDVLLEWCALDPVDAWEMSRNDVVGAIQGNRNVFIDYPEYAWLIFEKDIPTDMTTPSGKAAQSTQTPDQPEEDQPDQGTTENDPPQSGGHNHAFSEWLENGDGTSSRICLDCAHMETRQDGSAPTQPSGQTGGCASVVGIDLAAVACCAVAFVLVKRRKS